MSSQEPGTLVTIRRGKTQQAACAGDILGWARNGPLRTLTVGTLGCHKRHLPASPPPSYPGHRVGRARDRRQTDRWTDRAGALAAHPSRRDLLGPAAWHERPGPSRVCGRPHSWPQTASQLIPAVGTCSALLPDTRMALRGPARAVPADGRGADHKQPRSWVPHLLSQEWGHSEQLS